MGILNAPQNIAFKRAQLSTQTNSAVISKLEEYSKAINKFDTPHTSDDVREKIQTMFHRIGIDVFRTYLPQVHQYYSVIPLTEKEHKENETDEVDRLKEWKDNRIRCLEITKWVTDPEENSIDRLANVYQAFANTACNIGLVFRRTTDACHIYLVLV